MKITPVAVRIIEKLKAVKNLVLVTGQLQIKTLGQLFDLPQGFCTLQIAKTTILAVCRVQAQFLPQGRHWLCFAFLFRCCLWRGLMQSAHRRMRGIVEDDQGFLSCRAVAEGIDVFIGAL